MSCCVWSGFVGVLRNLAALRTGTILPREKPDRQPTNVARQCCTVFNIISPLSSTCGARRASDSPTHQPSCLACNARTANVRNAHLPLAPAPMWELHPQKDLQTILIYSAGSASPLRERLERQRHLNKESLIGNKQNKQNVQGAVS